MRSLFDEIEGIECSFPADNPKNRLYSEITNEAGMILYQMGVKMPKETRPRNVRQAVDRDRKLAVKPAG